MSAQKPPVAIRITRPYQTEDEFLARELDTISRTGVTLVGAQARPEGVVLRFELTLASGAALLRGEGRVVGYKATALGSEPGLSLRFTRLDSKSKALVDRVGLMREARRSIPPPAPSAPPRASIPDPVASAEAIPISVDLADLPGELPQAPPPSGPLARDEASPPPKVEEPSRIELLGRLRRRAQQIAQTEVERILADGAGRRRR